MHATPSSTPSTTLTFTTEQPLDDGVLERRFTLNDVPGILWTPPSATPSAPAPLILLGQPGGLGMDRMYPRLVGRARHAASAGIATVALEGPGNGDRPPLPGADQARADLRTTLAAGEPVPDDLVDRLVLPLVDQAAPEWQAALDALLALPGIAGPVGYSGGLIALGVRLALVEPRIVAAGLFAGSYVPRATFKEARRVTIPVHVLLQWDDEGNDRQAALDLFDALGSTEKTLQANLGGHTGVPAFAGDDAGRFFVRHLR
ncbi:alpha/beta hydrolase [Isoptericola sp. NPDC057391]|uniref:alpha/beta hydrolase n=1 Tax=Isoptericola sp. NPDC057391 TaxID=3346117 RepID=UPI003645A341